MLHFHYLYPYIYGKEPFQGHVKVIFVKMFVRTIFDSYRLQTLISGSQRGDYHLVKITYSSGNSTTIFEAPFLTSKDDIN